MIHMKINLNINNNNLNFRENLIIGGIVVINILAAYTKN